MFTRTRFVAIGCIVGLLLCGCRESGQPSSAKPPSTQPSTRTLRIAVIPKATNHEYWKSIHAGAVKAEMELEGVQAVWSGPNREDDRVEQIAVVENAVNAGHQGIVLAPLDEIALAKPVAEARRAGIPVVVMDSALNGEPGKDFVSYVATDNQLGGRMAARRMAELLNNRGRIFVIRYQAGSASTMQREQGFMDELSQFPEMVLAGADYIAGPTTNDAYNRAENLLRIESNLQGIFAACEPVLFGVLRAAQEAGQAGKIKLVGFDTSPKLIEAMRQDQVHGLVLQDPFNMGYLAVKTLVAHLRGEQVSPRIDTGCTLATPENMDQPRIRDLLSPPIDRYLQAAR